MKLCCIAGCGRKSRARSLCIIHYQRLMEGRDLGKPIRSVICGTDEARLRAKIRISQSGCWEWIASYNSNGYGQMRFRGTNFPAHRAAWIIFKGEIPSAENVYATLNVLHHCDNPKCVNPDHLFLGNQSDNALDAVSKNRWGPRGLSGEDHGRAKVTAVQVKEIRSSTESVATMAIRFGVSKSTIRHIFKRRSWNNI